MIKALSNIQPMPLFNDHTMITKNTISRCGRRYSNGRHDKAKWLSCNKEHITYMNIVYEIIMFATQCIGRYIITIVMSSVLFGVFHFCASLLVVRSVMKVLYKSYYVFQFRRLLVNQFLYNSLHDVMISTSYVWGPPIGFNILASTCAPTHNYCRWKQPQVMHMWSPFEARC